MEHPVEAVASNSITSRRHFLDLLLGASVLGWMASVAYPIIRYLKPLPQTGATGPTRLTRDEAAKLEQNKFVIVPVSGQRVIVFQSEDRLDAFSAKCTHEGCTVTFQPGQSIIWCPCHDGRFDLSGARPFRAAASTAGQIRRAASARRRHRHFRRKGMSNMPGSAEASSAGSIGVIRSRRSSNSCVTRKCRSGRTGWAGITSAA